MCCGYDMTSVASWVRQNVSCIYHGYVRMSVVSRVCQDVSGVMGMSGRQWQHGYVRTSVASQVRQDVSGEVQHGLIFTHAVPQLTDWWHR